MSDNSNRADNDKTGAANEFYALKMKITVIFLAVSLSKFSLCSSITILKCDYVNCVCI